MADDNRIVAGVRGAGRLVNLMYAGVSEPSGMRKLEVYVERVWREEGVKNGGFFLQNKSTVSDFIVLVKVRSELQGWNWQLDATVRCFLSFFLFAMN